ncbi:carbonic anhydrase [Marinobacter daqiaonensis]|uniref:Carbonic anhydrase n=1 Tax=Marinobacter daqiaonensis TaxID=650891 RepID=A0A1I6H5K1_9GAMM|nr:carbonate dehydratase [Marinobacter daqiaonensis]SFR49617.1 carbonic anhydrase [Marinobacter daqiaonensis]
MAGMEHLLRSNQRWAAAIKQQDPEFFRRLSSQQAPEYLWIGCADSRVPANQIVDLMPGQLFVHRNVANVVVHTDFNCLAVIQYAIDVLKVRHVLVVGHYNCGGVRAALTDGGNGLIGNWLRHVQDVRDKYQDALDQQSCQQDRVDRLCELNVVEQVDHVCQNSIIRNAWTRGQSFTVHGFIYDIADGLLRDLGLSISSEEERLAIKQQSVKELMNRPVRSGLPPEA